VKSLVRRDFAKTMRDSLDGKMKDKLHHLRVLDAYCDKYGVDDFNEFVPEELQKDVPGRVKHETTITDNFNASDAELTVAGSQLTWVVPASFAGDWAIVSNGVSATSGGDLFARNAIADSDLSSADHYSHVEISSVPIGKYFGSTCRADGDVTMYTTMIDGLGNLFLSKYVGGGAPTHMGTISQSIASGNILRVQSDGSTISAWVNGSMVTSVTDTAITGNLRCGLHQYSPNGTATMDDFEAADIGGGSGLLYTQLERGVRGVERGNYTKWSY
jgi:hypothetical protein